MTRYWIEPLWHETHNLKSMQKTGSKKVQWRYTVVQWSKFDNTRWNTGTNVGKAQTHVHFQGHPQQEKLNCYHQTLLEDDEPDRVVIFAAKQQGNDACELLQVIWATAPSHQFLKSVLLFFQVLWMANIIVFFEECIVFQAPAQFPKNKDVSNTGEYYFPLQ